MVRQQPHHVAAKDPGSGRPPGPLSARRAEPAPDRPPTDGPDQAAAPPPPASDPAPDHAPNRSPAAGSDQLAATPPPGPDPAPDLAPPRSPAAGSDQVAAPPAPVAAPPPDAPSWPWLPVLAALALVGLITVRAVTDTARLAGNPDTCLSGTTTPLLTANDGYYFLRLAEDAAAGRAEGLDRLRGEPYPRPLPLAAPLIAAASEALGLETIRVAFYLPVVAALLFLPVLWRFGAFLFGPIGAAAAMAAGSLAPCWIYLSGVGKCDTDVLNPVLFLVAAYFAVRCDAARGRGRLVPAVLFLAAALVFGWWWRPGLYLCLLFPACLSLGFALEPPGTARRRVKIGLLAGFVVAGLAFFITPTELLPGPAAEARYFLYEHVRLALRLGGGSAAAAGTISELRPLSLPKLARETSGGMVPFLLSLAGLWLLARRRPGSALALIPFLGPFFLSLAAWRFAALAVPLLALGFGSATGALGDSRFLRELLPRPGIRRGAVFLVLVLILSLGALRVMSARPGPPLTAADDRLALAAKAAAKGDARVFAWWDEGYFIQYRAGLPTFFDGGSQWTEACFEAAFPLAIDNPDLSRAWIRFFTAHGRHEFARLAARLGSAGKAREFLWAGLSGRTPPEALAAAFPGWDRDPEATRSYLFPEVEALLFLSNALLSTSGHWYQLGLSPLVPDIGPNNHLDVFPAEGFAIEAETGRAVLSKAARAKGYEAVGAAFDLDAGPLGQDVVLAAPDPYLFLSRRMGRAVIADRLIARTLAFRLLVLNDAPPGFRRRNDRPGDGGVFRLEAMAARRP